MSHSRRNKYNIKAHEPTYTSYHTSNLGPRATATVTATAAGTLARRGSKIYTAHTIQLAMMGSGLCQTVMIMTVVLDSVV